MAFFSIEIKNFTKMESPIGDKNITKYVMYAKTSSLENELMEWFETNPRSQNTGKKVIKSIKDSLTKNSDSFHNLNKGILFSAEYVKFNNDNNVVEFSLVDKQLHGNIDGGHTLKVILNENNEQLRHKSKYKDSLGPIESFLAPHDAYVFIEIMTGIKDRYDIIELASARNKTIQVDTKSIANLDKKFDSIKNLFNSKNIHFKDRILFKMNEEKEFKDKNIDIKYIISIMNMFNLDIYENNQTSQHPIQSYNGKETTLNQYLLLDKKEGFTIESSIKKFDSIIEKIFKLHDLIEIDFPNAFNSNTNLKQSLNYEDYKYAKLSKGSSSKSNFAKFDKSLRLYSKVPTGIIYPILGSFRALVYEDEQTKIFNWKSDPIEVWNKHKNKLAYFIADFDDVKTIHSIGVSNDIWKKTFEHIFSNYVLV